jgi:formate dehydrogenase iron-sulfur subunit
MKCTLCYDRMQNGLMPACAQACPTHSIQFGPIRVLRENAVDRIEQLHDQGQLQAQLYGADNSVLGGLNSFYLLMDEPEVYGLPRSPVLPSSNVEVGSALSALGAAAVGVLGAVALRKRRMDQFAAEARGAAESPVPPMTQEGAGDD